jgi:signal recognition particle subunit SRP19
MSENSKKVVVWPQYIDSTLPRRLGRRLPKEYSVSRPTLDELVNACKKLGLEFEVDNDSKYCRTWYLGSTGRVIIYNSSLSKLKLLRTLAMTIKELRSSSK